MTPKPVAKTPGLRKGKKPGVWHLEICVPGTHGKARKRKTIEAENRAEALARWSEFRREVIARGGRAKAWTLRAYVEAHSDTWAERYARKGSDLAYRCSVLIRELGDMRLDRINAAVVRDLMARLTKRYSPATANGLLATLRHVLRDAVDRSELVVYPIRGRLPLQRVEPLRLEMSDEERERLLAAFDDFAGFQRMLRRQRVERISESGHVGTSLPDGDAARVEFAFFRAFKPLFVVALETGLSRGDLLTLTWPEVAGPVIRRPRAKTRVEAVIPISPACREALDELKARALTGRTVFVSPHTGRPICIDTLNRVFRTTKEIAGITRRLRFHDLRHTFASRLASRGVPLQKIAKALGHSSIAMSQRYAHPSDESMLELLDALAANVLANSTSRHNGGR